MNWRKIVDAFKKLDDRLSDAVYVISPAKKRSSVLIVKTKLEIIHTKNQTPLVFMSLVNRSLTDGKTIDVLLSTDTNCHAPEPYATILVLLLVLRRRVSDDISVIFIRPFYES